MYFSQNGGHDIVESLMARGQTLEHNQNYTEAIDLYLQLDSSFILKVDKLQQVIWHSLVYLSQVHPSFGACNDMFHYRMVYLSIVHGELSILIKIQVFTILTLGLWIQHL